MHGDVRIRAVEYADLVAFYAHQLDPEASAMAAFPSRDERTFMAHWEGVLADPGNDVRTVVADGRVAGNVVSWGQDGRRLVGYWIGREHWGRGIATAAVTLFLQELTTRPLHAWVANHNVGSIRVLEKCGFQRQDQNDDEALYGLNA